MGGDARQSLGRGGEDAAERWLHRAGLTILERGFRARCGEIDLIARDGTTVVFVEVKTRSGSGFGHPSEAVTAGKRRRIARVALLYLARAGWLDAPCRFDVIEVMPGESAWRVRHIPDAFRPGD